MRIITNFNHYDASQEKPLVLILGNFDGLHAGHRALIKRGLEEAKRCHGQAGVLTFGQHPQNVLHPFSGPKLLSSLEQKMFLLEQLGVDFCFLIPFTREFSEISAEDFVEDILVSKLNVHEVCLGHNARFGHSRVGDVAMMKAMSKKFGFRFQEMLPISLGGETVSSSRTRELIESGDFEKAYQFLQRRFSFFGRVARGDGRGKTLGFPTANLESVSAKLLKPGVYSVKVRSLQISKASLGEHREDWKVMPEGDWLEAVLNFGVRPTFKSSEPVPVAEVHILDFEGDLYGRDLEIEVYTRLREEKSFSGPEALKSQILQDIEDTKNLFREGDEAPI